MLHVELVTCSIFRDSASEPYGFGFVREEHEPVFVKLNALQLKPHPQCDVIGCQHQGIAFPDRFNGGVGPVYFGGLGVEVRSLVENGFRTPRSTSSAGCLLTC